MLGDSRGGHKAGGAPLGRALHPCRRLWVFWLGLQVLWVSSGPRKIIVKFYSIWTPFGIHFLRSSKTWKKQKLALGSRLIG